MTELEEIMAVLNGGTQAPVEKPMLVNTDGLPPAKAAAARLKYEVDLSHYTDYLCHKPEPLTPDEAAFLRGEFFEWQKADRP